MTTAWQEEDGRQYAIVPPTDDEGVRGKRLLIANGDDDLEVAFEVLSKLMAPTQEITATWHRQVRSGGPLVPSPTASHHPWWSCHACTAPLAISWPVAMDR